jgi:hypothetical protein
MRANMPDDTPKTPEEEWMRRKFDTWCEKRDDEDLPTDNWNCFKAGYNLAKKGEPINAR